MQISQPPKIAQKWFCTQNLRMDLSFQEEKKLFENPTLGCRDIRQNPVSFFLGHPVVLANRIRIVEIQMQNLLFVIFETVCFHIVTFIFPESHTKIGEASAIPSIHSTVSTKQCTG